MQVVDVYVLVVGRVVYGLMTLIMVPAAFKSLSLLSCLNPFFFFTAERMKLSARTQTPGGVRNPSTIDIEDLADAFLLCHFTELRSLGLMK